MAVANLVNPASAGLIGWPLQLLFRKLMELMMLKFSDILRAEGIPVERTRLVRHTEQASRSAYQLWLEDLEKFEEYQAQQGSVKFEPANLLPPSSSPQQAKHSLLGFTRCMDAPRANQQ